MLRRWLLVSAPVVLALGRSAAAADFTVDTTVDAIDAIPGDGICATVGGACSVRAAIIETNALAGADVVSIPAGTYVLAIPGIDEDGSATGDLDILDDLTLEGAGPLLTILDGGGLDFVIEVRPDQVEISNVGIRGGVGAGVSVVGTNYGATTRIVDTIVDGNSGDGIFGNTFRLSVLRTTIRANSGSGIYVWVSAYLSVEQSVISDNHGVARGGGIYALGFTGGQPTRVKNSVVESNSPGGIFLQSDIGLIVEDSVVRENTGGPGIEFYDETWGLIKRTTIEGNQGQYAGGLQSSGLFGNRVIVLDSAIVGNESYAGAGGIQQSGAGALRLINTTISGNAGLVGGGVALHGAYENPLLIENCTISDNTASQGGGIALIGSDSQPSIAIATLVNTIVAGNAANLSAPDCLRVGDPTVRFVSSGHNLIGDASDCDFTAASGDLIGLAPATIDPILEPIELDEVPTPAHHLGPGSPAIDAGDGSSCASADQLGRPRPLDGNGDGIARCDIGATEASSGDSDLDSFADEEDDCPSVANASQSDLDADGVGDACDNCTTVANPRVSLTPDEGNLGGVPWATLTGGQRDDDHDGFGNVCDAKFVGPGTKAVGALDLAQFRASSGRATNSDTCGTTHAMPCAIFDLDENPILIDALDLARFRALSGWLPGPTCPTCPLACTAGSSGSCF